MPVLDQWLWAACLLGLAGIWAFVGYEFCQSRHDGGGGSGNRVPGPPRTGRTAGVDPFDDRPDLDPTPAELQRLEDEVDLALRRFYAGPGR